jgi:hypothetical protein
MSKGASHVEDGEASTEKHCFYTYMRDRGGQSDTLDTEVTAQIKRPVANGTKRLQTCCAKLGERMRTNFLSFLS